MSTKREPLLSDEHRDACVPYKHESLKDAWIWGFDACRNGYEAARAKDAELIQELLDSLCQKFIHIDSPIDMIRKAKEAIKLADTAGFKPTEP